MERGAVVTHWGHYMTQNYGLDRSGPGCHHLSTNGSFPTSAGPHWYPTSGEVKLILRKSSVENKAAEQWCGAEA